MRRNTAKEKDTAMPMDLVEEPALTASSAREWSNEMVDLVTGS